MNLLASREDNAHAEHAEVGKVPNRATPDPETDF